MAQEDVDAVVRALKSDWLTQGPCVDRFESAVAQYVDAPFAVAFSSGTAALHAAAAISGLEAGDEAITSPISFVATANCVVYAGATPRFVDVDPRTALISSEMISKEINSKTKVILPVDFAGHPADLEAIYAVARSNNLMVIDDAAHAIGAEYKDSQGVWQRCGNCMHADMAIFSFHPVKAMTTLEGGMVVTRREDLYRKLIAFRSHGITRDPSLLQENHGGWYYEMQTLGYNYRISDVQCALGLEQLKRLDVFIARRRAIADMYSQAFSGWSEIEPFQSSCDVKHARHIYVVSVNEQCIGKSRRDIFDQLRQSGIGVNVHYIPIYKQPFYRKRWGNVDDQFPNAEQYYRRAITLPIFPDMTDEDVQYVIACVERAVRPR